MKGLFRLFSNDIKDVNLTGSEAFAWSAVATVALFILFAVAECMNS